MLDHHNIENTNSESCGYDAYKACTNTKLNINEFNTHLNKKGNYSSFDLLKIAKLEKINLIVASATSIDVHCQTGD